MVKQIRAAPNVLMTDEPSIVKNMSYSIENALKKFPEPKVTSQLFGTTF